MVWKNGEVDRTFKVLDEMYKGNLPPTVVSFGSAISACGKVGIFLFVCIFVLCLVEYLCVD